MYINWREAKDKEVFGLAKTTKLGEVRKIHFVNLFKEESKEVLEYLVANYPRKLRIFAFDANIGIGYGNGDFYLKGIEKVSGWVV